MPTHHAPVRALAAALLVSSLLAVAPAAAAPADASVKAYKNCTAVHKVYSGGIAKTDVTKNTITHSDGSTTKKALKGKVLHSTATYKKNKKLDKDGDGVACEKS